MRKNLLVITVSTLALTACDKVLMNPSPMPAAYTYHQENYKAPPAAKAWDLGHDETGETNEEIMALWYAAGHDLLLTLEQETGITAQDVYVAPPKIDNAFTFSLDHALRDALMKKGYKLVPEYYDGVLVLEPDTYDPKYKNKMRSYIYNDNLHEDEEKPPKKHYKNLVLTLEAFQGGLIGKVEIPNELPLYGYKDKQLYFSITQGFAEIWR